MPRIRTIKPEFFTSEDVGSWSDSTQVIFMGLIVMASDNGIGPANPRLLAGQLRPYQPQDEALMRIHEAFSETRTSGSVVLFRRSDRDFYWIANFSDHQYVQHPSKKLPELPTEAEIRAYEAHHGSLTSEDAPPVLTLMSPHEDVMNPHPGKERKGREGKGREVTPRDAARPAVQLPLTAEVSELTSEGTEVVTASVRPDVEALCTRLHEKLIENDYKPLPKITDAWRREARLLIDKDERNLDQALKLIAWALENEFWSTNIASMGKFRLQYPKLLAAAKREHAAQQPRTAPPTVRSQRLAATAAMVARLREEEAAEQDGAALPNFARRAIQA